MARAKTTDRAEARRRYRALMAAEAAAGALDGEEGVPSDGGAMTSTSQRARPVAAPPRGVGSGSATQPRMSLLAALRTAAAPADVVDDVRALPWIATRTKAIWLPALLIGATGVAFLIPTLADNAIVRFLGVALLAPPPMIPAFLAGMLTPRASWLAGGIAGLLGGLMVAILITIAPSSASSTQGLDFQNLGFLVVAGPVFGMGVGAFSGFYRRFLALSSPQRQQQRKSGQSSRGPAGRRR